MPGSSSVGPHEHVGAWLTAPSPRRRQAGVRTFLPVPAEAVFLQLVRQRHALPLPRAPGHRATALAAASVPGQRPHVHQRRDHCVGARPPALPPRLTRGPQLTPVLLSLCPGTSVMAPLLSSTLWAPASLPTRLCSPPSSSRCCRATLPSTSPTQHPATGSWLPTCPPPPRRLR